MTPRSFTRLPIPWSATESSLRIGLGWDNKPAPKEKYLLGVKEQTQRHKIEQKIHLLTEIVSYPPSEHFIQSQNQIDIVQRDIMRSAENKCRNWHMGEVDYSLQVMIWWHRRLT